MQVVQTITNITKSIVNWKREFLHICISKILFIDTEKLSKMQISLQVFFKDFTGRFRITYLKNGFFWSCFWEILLIDFRIDTNLKTGLSKKVFSKDFIHRFWNYNKNNLFKGTLTRNIAKTLVLTFLVYCHL